MVCMEDQQIQIFLHKGINTIHKFLCKRNAVCMHVRCIVVTMQAICKGLMVEMLTFLLPKRHFLKIGILLFFQESSPDYKLRKT